MFVVAKRVARSILERVYCCHRAKQMSARGVHKTQAKVPILGLNHVLPIQPMLASYIQGVPEKITLLKFLDRKSIS